MSRIVVVRHAGHTPFATKTINSTPAPTPSAYEVARAGNPEPEYTWHTYFWEDPRHPLHKVPIPASSQRV